MCDKLTSIAKWAVFYIPLNFITLMTNEALKLMQSKRNNGPVILMYTINILMDPSIYINRNIIIILKIMIIRPKYQN
jgi:hypothetical protein